MTYRIVARSAERRVRHRRAVARLSAAAIPLAIGVLTGCAPSGPPYDELNAEPVFAAAMRDSTVIADGGADPAWRFPLGPSHGFATRLWATEASEHEVLAWHLAILEEKGWRPVTYSYISMPDGRLPEHAWRKGDLVMALGFPDRGSPQLLAMADEVGDATTIFHTSITHRAED